MATNNTLDYVKGYGLISGAVLYTVPEDTTLTVVGMVFNNLDTVTRTFSFQVKSNGESVNFDLIPPNLQLPPMTGYAPSEVGKIVVKAGDQIILKCDEDNMVNGFISFLKQTEV